MVMGLLLRVYKWTNRCIWRFKINFLKIQEFNSNNNNNFKLKVNQFIDTYDDKQVWIFTRHRDDNVTDKKPVIYWKNNYN